MAGELLKELEDDIHQEEWWSFWRTYGVLIAGLVVLTLVTTGGYLWWRSQSQAQLEKASERYEKALSLLVFKGPNAETHAVLQALAEGSDKGYALLSQLQLFRLSVQGALGNPSLWEDVKKRGQALLQKAQQDRDTGLEGFVVLTLATFYMNTAQPLPPDISQRLATYDMPQNPWKGLAGEFEALSCLSDHKIDAAEKIYRRLLTQPDIPQAVQMRASMVSLGKGLPFPEGDPS